MNYFLIFANWGLGGVCVFVNAVASGGSAGNLASSLTVEIWRQINSSDEDEASCSAVTEQSALPEGGRTTSNSLGGLFVP